MFHRIVRRRVSPYVYGLRIACHAVAHVALQWCLPVVIAGKLNDHSRSYELRGLSYHMLCPMLDRMLYDVVPYVASHVTRYVVPHVARYAAPHIASHAASIS